MLHFCQRECFLERGGQMLEVCDFGLEFKHLNSREVISE